MTLNALANASDVDVGDTLGVVGIPALLPAGVTYDAATRAFTLDPTNPAYQSLASRATTTVTVEYGVSDGSATTPASVRWTVTGTDAPVAIADSAITSENSPVTIDVLANDTDLDGDALSVTQIDGQAVASGQTVTLAGGAQATLNGNGTITYAPAVSANGAVSFGYAVSDGKGGTASADVGVTIAPVAIPALISVAGGTSLVSVSSAGEQGNSDSYAGSISADGRYVTFWSQATNLVAGDTNGAIDVFVRDLQTGITTLVSASSAGEQGNSILCVGRACPLHGRSLQRGRSPGCGCRW